MMRRTVVPVVLSAVLLGALDAAAQDQDMISVELGLRGYTGEIQGRLRNGNPPSIHRRGRRSSGCRHLSA